jgi:hypothetical protein
MRTILIISSVCLAVTILVAQPSYLYKVTLVQAGPGKLLELIESYKALMPSYSESGDEPPLWVRHSQGDQWDLMMIFPIGSYREYFNSDRLAKREKSQHSQRLVRQKIADAIAWREDLFAYGPPLNDLKERFAQSAFFHVEMFVSLTGKQAALYKERQMENAYLKTLNRPENFIFVRDQGASWDLFTLGTYRDLKHYAESVNISEADQEAAAKSAGFEGAKFIGPYLRTLINRHHDTLATAIK